MALQMNWQPSLIRRKSTNPPLGLRNLGNTCYLNSVLQCLTYTPPLANFCLKTQHTSLCDSNRGGAKNPNPCPFCILEKRIIRSLSVDNPQEAPVRIQSFLHIFADHFRPGRQEDAHEFLRYVIDACHNTCLRLKKLKEPPSQNGAAGGGGENTVVMEIFGGALRSQVKCLSCGGESNKTDEIMDISLDLFHSTSLKDAMQRFFQPEVLDGSNQYKCEKCKKLVVAKKQMSILKAPNILVIQLKRFEGIHGAKIDRAIAFEELLLLSNYMCKESQDPHPEYNLFGTIVHSGYSPDSGHYYAYIKDAMGRWYCCNDSHVSLSTLQEVLSENVYLLFFSRTNQRSRPTKFAFSANGLKSAYRNGHHVSPTKEAALSLKSVGPKPYGIHKAEKLMPTISKNGKVHSGPPIKFGFSKTPDSRRVYGNGNGNGNGNGHALTNGHAHTNGHVKNHIEIKESSFMEKINNKMTSVTNGTGVKENGSCNDEEHKIQQKLLSHENGDIQNIDVKAMKTEMVEDSGLGHATVGRGNDSGYVLHGEEEKYPMTISGHKRKSLDQESIEGGNHATVEKIKDMIARDASSRLRSCGWYEEVYSFMRAKRRSLTQTTDNTISKNELKEMLIADAKPKFNSEIPQSLKEYLWETLKSLSRGREILDA